MRVSFSKKKILSIAFAVKYFDQETPNDTARNHFLPGNNQDSINTFWWKLNWFLCEILHHEKPGDIQSNPLDDSMKRSTFVKKNVNMHPKQSDLYGIFLKINTNSLRKATYGPFLTKPPASFKWVKRYGGKDCLHIGLL